MQIGDILSFTVDVNIKSKTQSVYIIYETVKKQFSPLKLHF